TQTNVTVNAAAYNGARFTCLISNSYGAVVSTPAVLTVAGPVYLFGGPDGGLPADALIRASDGSLYGATEYGGSHGDGTIFRLGTNGALATLASFDGTNGAFPNCGLIQG